LFNDGRVTEKLQCDAKILFFFQLSAISGQLSAISGQLFRYRIFEGSGSIGTFSNQLSAFLKKHVETLAYLPDYL